MSDLTLSDRLLAVLMEQPTPTTNEEAEALAGLLAGVANAATWRAIEKVHRYWDDIPDGVPARRHAAMRTCDVIAATLDISPVKVGDVRHAQGMEATVVDITDNGFVGFKVDGCWYSLTLSTFMRNWSNRA